jgi:hypothetical protein
MPDDSEGCSCWPVVNWIEQSVFVLSFSNKARDWKVQTLVGFCRFQPPTPITASHRLPSLTKYIQLPVFTRIFTLPLLLV